jgi:hypothetical protein
LANECREKTLTDRIEQLESQLAVFVDEKRRQALMNGSGQSLFVDRSRSVLIDNCLASESDRSKSNIEAIRTTDMSSTVHVVPRTSDLTATLHVETTPKVIARTNIPSSTLSRDPAHHNNESEHVKLDSMTNMAPPVAKRHSTPLIRSSLNRRSSSIASQVPMFAVSPVESTIDHDKTLLKDTHTRLTVKKQIDQVILRMFIFHGQINTNLSTVQLMNRHGSSVRWNTVDVQH